MKPLLTVALGIAAAGAAFAQTAPAASDTSARPSPRDVRYVVFHAPGPKWAPGTAMFDQPGIREHVEHYGRLLKDGKLELGGPHLDARGGGMMVPVAGVTLEEITRFAQEDPAVRSGLLVAEVRPWLVGLRRP